MKGLVYMAGIGFELKKIFSKKSLTAKLGGVFYSVFSTIGHVLTVIAVLLLVRYFMDIYHTSIYVRELYAAIILYSFIFPLIFSSGICIILSRYIADMLWQGKHSDVLASAKGVIALYAIIASLPAIILLAHATDLSLLLRLFAYLLYMNMGIIFILMVYVSALKDYTQIALSFFIGMSVVLLLSWYTVAYHPFSGEIVTYLIGYFALGTTIIACGIYLGIRKYFKKASGNCFSFLKYFGKHKFLFWSNTFYTAALYIQNFSFWINTATRDQVSVFVYSEEFDLGTAFALYTTLPVVVI
ncbi:MAG: exopolysaccharide Pel transporter PelG, partial [Clostridia bacterium]